MLDGIRKSIFQKELTIIVGLLEVHVDNAAGPDIRHLWTVNSLNFGEETAFFSNVATILGKEGRDRVVCKFCSSLVITRLGEGRATAPRIDVVSPEINCRVGGTTVEVVGKIGTDGSIIVGSIANTNRSVILGLDVGLGVTDGGLDKGTSSSVVDLVRDFVASKEAQGVCVRGHCVNDGGIAGEEVRRPLRRVAIDRLLWAGKILEDIDACRL